MVCWSAGAPGGLVLEISLFPVHPNYPIQRQLPKVRDALGYSHVYLIQLFYIYQDPTSEKEACPSPSDEGMLVVVQCMS